MSLDCAAVHLSGMPDIPVALRVNQMNQSPEDFPVGPEHVCEHCRLSFGMHGAPLRGFKFVSVLSLLDASKIHPDADKHSPDATICTRCFNELSCAPGTEDAAMISDASNRNGNEIRRVPACEKVIRLNPQKKEAQTIAEEVAAADDYADEDMRKTTKKRRKRKASPKERVELTNRQKLAILDEIDRKITSQKAVVAKYGINRNTIYYWRKNKDMIKQSIEEEGRGDMKRVQANDGLMRIRDGVRAFFDVGAYLNLPLTRAAIAAKAVEIKGNLLRQHKESPMLSDLELKALSEFKASESWAGKFARDNGWRSKALHNNAGAMAEAGAVDADADLKENSDTIPKECRCWSQNNFGVSSKRCDARSCIVRTAKTWSGDGKYGKK
mmetsp:Transcript_12391/g.21463  ORF Transcript_12391/g.21463 Transcript_12391/m.21463 type:complete len:383 (-) Transcript_12391:294-1442(-)